jgi:hypothetical protein
MGRTNDTGNLAAIIGSEPVDSSIERSETRLKNPNKYDDEITRLSNVILDLHAIQAEATGPGYKRLVSEQLEKLTYLRNKYTINPS